MSVFIIAEAGVNHNGSLSLAKQLVDVAVEAGADAVKFQTFKASNLVTKKALKADYQKQNTNAVETQYEMIRRLELSESHHDELVKYCAERGIMFMSTPFDHESIDYLDRIGMSIFKIPSGELTNLPYLRHVASKQKPVILSTGMANLGEVEGALAVLLSSGLSRDEVTILHATTEYPCPKNEVNLSAMKTMRQAFRVQVGYSDHTQGIEVPIAAVAMGASVIEKHFTLDHSMDGPDHKASLEPSELIEMVRAIRTVESAIGDGIKQPSSSELKNIHIARKSIVAACAIKKGETFTAANMTVKRPGTGISPMSWDRVMGTVAQKDYEEDDAI